MTWNLKSGHKLSANVFRKQPGFSEEPELQNLMLRTSGRPHNQQVLVAVSMICLTNIYFFYQTTFWSQNLKMHWQRRWHCRLGSLFEVKSFPGASYSQHHVVRDQQVVKGGVVRHRLQLQANHAD